MVPGGLLAVVHMNWLPHEDPVARMSEEVILACNPAWTGGGFRPSPLREYGPAKERFTRQAAFAWREALPFSIDSWAGRLRSCRGLGASLPPERVAAFERAAPDPAGRRSRRTVHGPALCRNRTSPAERRQGALTSAPACSSRTGPSTCRSSWLNGIEMPRSSKSSATFSRSVDSTMTCAPVRTQTRSVKSIALS